MTYKIADVEIIIQPTEGRWVPLSPLGFTGNGSPVYSSVRTFEMRWNLMDASGTSQLLNFYNSLYLTGTTSVDLPYYGSSEYVFHTYSGCTLYQPEFGAYFSENTTNVVGIIGNIIV